MDSLYAAYGAPIAHRGPTGSSQAQAIDLDDEFDTDDGLEDAPDATQAYNSSSFSFEIYGIFQSKIVGCRFYNGVATVGEMVVLKREPQNPYDRNAIQVLNVQRTQIGHIPRQVAGKLAKYMDAKSLLIEASITGPKGEFDCPIELRLYGTDDPRKRDQLKKQMQADRLPVGNMVSRVKLAERAQKERIAQQEKLDKERKKAIELAQKAARSAGVSVGLGSSNLQIRSSGEYAAGSAGGLPTVEPPKTLDSIIMDSEQFNPRNYEEMVDQFGISEEKLASMPKADQPKGLLTRLHPFQLQGLQWMLDKESPKLPTVGSKEVVQFWQRNSRNSNLFTHIATNFTTRESPRLASGGILADDMGLGKTISVISLILADKALGRKNADVSGATLILAPVSVMSNWSSQMAKHIEKEHSLRIMFYHSTLKKPLNPQEIDNYDIVISTYDTVSSEWWKSAKPEEAVRKDGVFSVNWRRVVLDEGHHIRNPASKRAQAAWHIKAQSKWALSGTPIVNNLKDLYSLVKFIDLPIMNDITIFNHTIIRPMTKGDKAAVKLLKYLMGEMCLRRRKDMSFIDLRLPELSEYIHRIKFSPNEQEMYDVLAEEAKGRLDMWLQEQQTSTTNKVASGTNSYRGVLEIILRMRQVCNHYELVGTDRLGGIMAALDANGFVDLTPDNKLALQQLLQLSIDSQEDCPVCLDTFKDPVITKCAHVFCTPCIERVIDTQHRCPMCRAELDALGTTTVKPMKEGEAANGGASTTTQPEPPSLTDLKSSSKVAAILAILRAQQKDPSKGNKTIVFSQWTSFLDLLTPHLRDAGFGLTRIDGTMRAADRDRALDALESDPQCTVMLASLAVASVGLNLVAANSVILADSWWAPAIEDQAVDRVHRLGQKRECTVFRIVIEKSVEEKVLGIQEKKRQLVGVVFNERDEDGELGGRKKKGRRRVGGVEDLRTLLG
ncbi:putative SNF2 family helicase [Lophium mytilinum]|uniref:Putative SNF2 family helicase n=1 Tax=Lophium mytilinum TaxID=390894 RepID=A0A6A6R861_9PEZI|nr:putative SNF2 family helicase [Lophium mytilinum]